MDLSTVRREELRAIEGRNEIVLLGVGIIGLVDKSNVHVGLLVLLSPGLLAPLTPGALAQGHRA